MSEITAKMIADLPQKCKYIISYSFDEKTDDFNEIQKYRLIDGSGKNKEWISNLYSEVLNNQQVADQIEGDKTWCEEYGKEWEIRVVDKNNKDVSLNFNLNGYNVKTPRKTHKSMPRLNVRSMF